MFIVNGSQTPAKDVLVYFPVVVICSLFFKLIVLIQQYGVRYNLDKPIRFGDRVVNLSTNSQSICENNALAASFLVHTSSSTKSITSNSIQEFSISVGYAISDGSDVG